MKHLDPTQWTVLIVEDDPDQRIVMTQVLDFFDAKVTAVSSGGDALKLLNESGSTFTVGLLDLRMPGMSGWQLLEEIRKHPTPEVRDMPLIAVTANVMHGDRERVIRAGFTGYIPKPVEPTTLVQEISDILNKEQADKL